VGRHNLPEPGGNACFFNVSFSLSRYLT
jgi:hypothetical protein